uniref:Uncharacterized protein n=1 Tax=Lygus hesperus TaxID=30085 RepID=A0A146M325_LYGHE
MKAVIVVLCAITITAVELVNAHGFKIDRSRLPTILMPSSGDDRRSQPNDRCDPVQSCQVEVQHSGQPGGQPSSQDVPQLRYIIKAPYKVCPNGQQRDARGNCRTVLWS